MCTRLTCHARAQIKRYYHRLLRKINVLLAPAIEAINLLDADDVRLSLLSWCVSRPHLWGPSSCDMSTR